MSEWTLYLERTCLIEQDSEVTERLDALRYSFPDGWDFERVRLFLGQENFSRIRREEEPEGEWFISLQEQERDVQGKVVGIGIMEDIMFALPDGWSYERVRLFLAEHGFERVDNRQDPEHPDDPFPYH